MRRRRLLDEMLVTLLLATWYQVGSNVAGGYWRDKEVEEAPPTYVHDGDPDEDVGPDGGVHLGGDEGDRARARGVGDDEEPAHETRPRGDAGEQAHGEHHGAAEPDPARPHEEHVQPVELVPEDGVARRDD